MAYEGPNVYRAPYASSEAYSNFERTALTGVSLDTVHEHTDREFDGDRARLWGTTVEGSWKRIEPGDYLIFYRNGAYEHAAKVTDTERNEALGREVWPNHDSGDPWYCIIYLEEPIDLGVDSELIHDLAGYEVSHTQNFAPLNEMGIGGIVGRWGSVEEFINADHGSSEEQTTLDATGGSGSSPDATTDPEIDIRADPDVDVPESVLDGLYFPDDAGEEILDDVNSALNAGKHVIFTGPPGTGKTEIAQRVADYLADEHPDVYSGFQTTTATADWSTFETVGGYMPEEGDGDDLSFSPGQVLRCFKRDDRQRNDLLVIDEINRSDIDKSFGQLFTLLSGQGVQLPFTAEEEEVTVVPGREADGGLTAHEYVMPSSWRIFATMNSYDKTSLYEMSYAFMRRFAFVHVGAPDGETTEDWSALVRNYADTWDVSVDDRTIEVTAELWRVTNSTVDERRIGPALVEDILRHVAAASDRDAMTSAVTSYIFPQLEGLRRREEVVAELAQLPGVDRRRLLDRANEMLQVTADG
ncbi:AAA family ATPase [Halomicrobium salinisoli]|uniref:AAA family ATPase n=1 Tax=Halomicrobium salinisoli TaxID=2878391 RepID=UPI001CEFD32D|nr:MoxR family ATPase [Halomicrobium salinisoli]